MLPTELTERVLAWQAQDPDPGTRAELQVLLDAADEAALRDRFDARIGFGTAGLRGELGAGPNRMNRVLVAQAAAGIGAYLSGIGGKTVGIGYDGRVNSDVFARDSAEILAAAGYLVVLFDSYVPTPVLAFATRHGVSGRPFDIGIMVTASHNPPRDNGYKVYAGSLGGSQIIAPIDKAISAEILKVAESKTFAELPKSENFVTGGQELREAYLEATARLAGPTQSKHPKITLTAMHGVGWATTRALFQRAGLPEPATVPLQIQPDGSFPTVAFPNPEEAGALDLAMAEATANGSQLILALDPDADRLAVAVPDPAAPKGWRQLTGDQVGFILGCEVAERASAEGRSGTIACSIASSSALKSVAESHGLTFRQTLTGFKWISKVPGLIFGFEEALGYCLDPENTPDKDGISAALVVANLAARLAAEGTSLEAHLNRLYERHGHWATGQVTLRFDNVAKATAIVAGLRQNPPSELAGLAAGFEDLAQGTAELPPTDGLRFTLADGRRVLIRPSGTEPKLKCYLESKGESLDEANRALAELAAAVKALL